MIQENHELKDLQTALGNRIRNIRQQKGWSSQESFAAACGINRTHLGQIERGQVNGCISILVEIATRLEMTLSDLLDDIG